MTRIIKLNDGTVFPIGMCGESSGILWIRAVTNIVDACAVFSDPEKTRVITDTIQEDESLRHVVYEGYTDLIHLSTYTDDGTIQIGLKKG